MQLLHDLGFFGGKGKFVNFFETGDELFEVMSRMETELKVHSFFVMDENFLLHRDRAMRLARADERSEQELDDVGLGHRQTRSGSIRCRNWWNWAFPGYGWDWSLHARATANCREPIPDN